MASGNLSPRLFAWHKCNDNSGSYIKDYSGNGNDVSPLYAPDWRPGAATFAGKIICDPVSFAAGKFQECTQSGTTGTTRPTFSTTESAAPTASDGTTAWICRSVPNFWTTPGRLTCNGFPNWNTCIMRGSEYARELLLPYPDGNVTYTSTTIGFSTTASTITDSAGNGLGVFVEGDWIRVSGAANENNNGIYRVAQAPTVSSLVCSFNPGNYTKNPGPGTSAAPSPSVTLTKVVTPLSWVHAFWINYGTPVAAGNPWSCRPHWGSVNTSVSSQQNTGRTIGAGVVTASGTGGTTNSTGTTVLSTDTHVTLCADLERGWLTLYLNGVFSDVTSIVKLGYVSKYPAAGTLAAPFCHTFFGLQNGTQIWDSQLYIGRNIPNNAGVIGDVRSLTSSHAVQMMNGQPMTRDQWA